MNSLHVQRLLRGLAASIATPEPASTPAPEPKPKAAPKPRKVPVAHHSESIESDSGSESSSYDGYESVDNIKKHFAEEPCEYISPAVLSSKATTKDAVKYLESKQCPKIHRIKKTKMSSPAAPAPDTAPASAPAKKAKKAAAPLEPASPGPTVVLAKPEDAAIPKKTKKVAKKVEAPTPAPTPAPAVSSPLAPPPAPAEKKKRAPSAYALAVGRHRKAGLSFADAAKAAKAELDSKKA